MKNNETRSGTLPRFAWAITPAKVRETIRRIIEVGQPRKIVIFGSFARGQTKTHSDLDVLVIKRGPVRNPRRESVRIRSKLSDIMMPMDIVVVPESRLSSLVKRQDLIYHEALTTGRIVYEAAE